MPHKIQRLFLIAALSVPFCMVFSRAIADIVMGLTSLGFLYHSWKIRAVGWFQPAWVKTALVIWIYLIICGLFSLYDVSGGVWRGVTWLRFPLFALAFATWLLPLDRGYRYLRLSLTFLLVFISLDTLLQFLTGSDMFGFKPATYAHRLTGPFSERVVPGTFLARLGWPLIGIAFGEAIQQKNIFKRLGWPLTLMALFGLTILLTGERMAFVLYALSAIFFCAAAKRIRLHLMIIGASIAACAIAVIMLNPTVHERFIVTTVPMLQHFDQTAYGRIYENAYKAWRLAPIMGIGPKNFIAACVTEGQKLGFKSEAQYTTVFNCARHPHNVYLEWLVETGIIGLGLFVVLIYFWCRVVLQRFAHTDLSEYYVALGFAVSLLPVLWPFMSSMSFFINWSAILFWWIMGIALTTRQKSDSPSVSVPQPI